MTKTALENAQEYLRNLEGDYKHKGEAAIGWAVLAVATQFGRVATELKELRKELSEHK